MLRAAPESEFIQTQPFGRYDLPGFIAIIVICFTPLFRHLGEAPVQVWDEMRNAQNALEMSRTGNLIVTTFGYEPETWNTKPPLMIWLLAISQKLFGASELSIRLPSAAAALATAITIATYLRYRLNSWLPGIIATIVLVTSGGYVALHGTRTGDFDALLTMFTTVTVCAFAIYVDEAKKRFLWIATVALIGAILTKGIAGFFVIPAVMLYAALRGRFARSVFTRTVFYSALVFLIVVAGYYGLREVLQPGYLKLVWENELGGRYASAIESHKGDAWMYYTELESSGFSSWMKFIIPVCLGGFFYGNSRARNIALLASLVALTVTLLLSMAQTKIRWYIMPVYPFLAVLYGVFFFQFLEIVKRYTMGRARAAYWASVLLLIVSIGYTPYQIILELTLGGKYWKAPPEIRDPEMYFKEVLAGKRRTDGRILCAHDTYHLYWYRSVLGLRGLSLTDRGLDSIGAGMHVVAWEDDIKGRLIEKFHLTKLDSLQTVAVFHIDAAR